MRRLKWFIVPLCMICVGCATRHSKPLPATTLQQLGTIAVVPFENYSDNANAGLIVADQLANELMTTTQLSIMDPEQVRMALAPHAGEVLSAQKMASLLKVHTLITGAVTEYRYKSGVSQQAVLAMTVYVVDTSRGRVLWSANTAQGSSSFFDRSGLGSLVQDQCAAIVAEMVEKKVDDTASARDKRTRK